MAAANGLRVKPSILGRYRATAAWALAVVWMCACLTRTSAWASVGDYVADASRYSASGDLLSARLQLRNAIKAEPKNAAAHYQLGLINLRLGDPTAAEKEARVAQEQGYDAAAVLALLTQTYLVQGRFRDLLRDFPMPKLGASNSGGIEAGAAAVILVARGRADMALDQIDDADGAFAEAARLAPQSPSPLLAQAQAALVHQDRATATAKVAAALKLAPNDPDVLQLDAGLLADKGDADAAIAAANQAVAAAPGQLAYRLQRAGLLINFNHNAQARSDVDAVLAAAPNNAQALYFRAVLSTRAGNFQAAGNDFDKLSDFITHNPGAYLVFAFVKQQLGQTEQALDAAGRYVARNPLDPRGALLLARLQIQTKHPEQAVATLTPLVNADSKEAAVYDLRAAALTLAGHPAEASADYQRALALRPDDAGLLARAGASRLSLNQPAAAAALLGRSVGLSPDQPRTEAMLATAQIDERQFDAAQATIARLSTQPGNAETVAMLNGAMHLARFELAAARTEFEGVLHDQIDARLSLATVAQLQGQEAERLRWLNEVLQREPARVQVLNIVVDSDVRQGRRDEAIAVLERAVAAAPTDPGIAARLASLYIGAGQADKALALANQPLPNPGGVAGETSMAPGAGARALPWLLIRAEAQIALNQNAAAEATYRDVLTSTPNFVLARLQLARLLLAADHVADARSVIEDGLAADPQNANLLRASVDIDGKVGGLAAALSSAATLAQDPTHLPAALSLRGDLYAAAKQFDDAASAYAEALKAVPNARLALNLAQAQLARGHADQATEGLRNWHAQHPDDLDAAQMLSDLELRAGHLDAAKALLTDLLAKRPSDARVLNNLAWVDQQQKDPQAASLAERAYRLAPGPQTADTLGYILATSGTADYGLALLRVAAEQAPADAAIQYHLAVAYREAGQKEAAVKLLRPLVDAPGEFSEKAQAKQLLTALSAKP